MHEKNIESLAIEMYKLQAALTPTIRENKYNFRNFLALESPQGTTNMERLRTLNKFLKNKEREA